MNSLVLILAAWPQLAPAQPELRRLTLAGENQQNLLRVQTADHLVHPVHSSVDLVKLIGAWGGSCFSGPGFLGQAQRPREDWLQAMEEYQRLHNEAGDALTPSGAGAPDGFPFPSMAGKRLVQLRWSHLPASVRQELRRLEEPAAQRLLILARETRSTAPLHRLAEEHFSTRSGAQALDVLAELALEKGHPNEALAWWSLLAPLPAPAAPWTCEVLRHPDPGMDPALIHAKQILALALGGELWESRLHLNLLRRRSPSNRGKLAGQEGVYHEILEEHWRRLQRSWSKEPAVLIRPDSAVLTRSLSPRLWARGASWHAPLPPNLKQPPHALIQGEHLVWAESAGITALHLQTGKIAASWKFSQPNKAPPAVGSAWVAARPGKVVFAGPGSKKKSGSGNAAGTLVCLDFTWDKDPAKGTLLESWRTPCRWSDGNPAWLAGTPISLPEAVVVPLALPAGFSTQVALAAFDWQRGKLLWFQELAQIEEKDHQRPPVESLVQLSHAPGAVVATVHGGGVVALDAATGLRWWGRRYPSTRMLPPHALTGSPCLTQGRRLYFSPADSDRLFCLDLFTGAMLWQRDRPEQGQWLALTQGRLLLTTAQGLRGLSAATGLDVPGWQQPALGRLTTRGQGLVAGDWVLWPTTDPMFPVRGLTVRSGAQEMYTTTGPHSLEPTSLRGLPAGNLLYGAGCLAVVTPEQIVGFLGK